MYGLYRRSRFVEKFRPTVLERNYSLVEEIRNARQIVFGAVRVCSSGHYPSLKPKLTIKNGRAFVDPKRKK